MPYMHSSSILNTSRTLGFSYASVGFCIWDQLKSYPSKENSIGVSKKNRINN